MFFVFSSILVTKSVVVLFSSTENLHWNKLQPFNSHFFCLYLLYLILPVFWSDLHKTAKSLSACKRQNWWNQINERAVLALATHTVFRSEWALLIDSQWELGFDRVFMNGCGFEAELHLYSSALTTTPIMHYSGRNTGMHFIWRSVGELTQNWGGEEERKRHVLTRGKKKSRRVDSV